MVLGEGLLCMVDRLGLIPGLIPSLSARLDCPSQDGPGPGRACQCTRGLLLVAVWIYKYKYKCMQTKLFGNVRSLGLSSMGQSEPLWVLSLGSDDTIGLF